MSGNDHGQGGAEHKRRQKARKKQRKQDTLDDLFHQMPWDSWFPSLAHTDGESVPSLASIELALSTAFDPIPRWEESDSSKEGEKLFWGRIPAVCTPQSAVLDQALSSERLLQGDLKRQHKYQRKLQHQLRRGHITESEYQTRLAEKNRRVPTGTSSEASVASSSPPVFRLMGANRGERKKWQVECFASLLWLHTARSRAPTPSQDGANLPEEASSLVLPQPVVWPRAPSLPHWLQEAWPLEGVRRVVDFGCGSGNLCLALAAHTQLGSLSFSPAIVVRRDSHYLVCYR